MRKRYALFFILASFASVGAESRTTNFVVHASDPQVCQSIAQWAEHYRKEKAIQWLGQEMPNWPQPCPLYVTVNMQGPSGATSFNFGSGRVMGMKMEIQGPLERLIHSVLPHEVTHTVFAHHFRQPVPRWADEGGSVLSEDDIERDRHDKLVRQILNNRQQIPLRTLLGLKEYPPQVMCLYAQGFSMCDFLVRRSDRKTFLSFVGQGMQQGWDQAARSFFGHNTVEEMEQAWLQSLREGRRPSVPPTQIAMNNEPKSSVPSPAKTVVRLTVPPSASAEPQPVVRGAMPSTDQVGQQFRPVGQGPRYLPDPSQGWQPGSGNGVKLGAPTPMQPTQAQLYLPTASVAAPRPTSPVRLGVPEFNSGPRQVPQGSSPIGFPY